MRCFTSILIFLLFAEITAAQQPRRVIDLGPGSQPRIATSADGSIYIVLAGANGSFCLRSDDAGQNWSSPISITTIPKGIALGMRRGPRICAAGDAIVVSVIPNTTESSDNGNLIAVRSTDGGRTWSGPIKISDAPAAAREGLDGIASDGKDNIAAVWLDDRDGGKKVMSSISTDRGKSWSKNVLVYHSPDGHVCECCHPSVAIDDAGNIHVMFRNWLSGNRDMYVATSSDSGKTWSAATRLGSGSWRLNGCPMDGGEIATMHQISLTVWQRAGSLFFASNDAAVEKKIDAGRQPSMAVVDGKPWVAYLQGNDLWASPPVGQKIRLAGDAAAPVLSALNDHVLCAWESREHVFVAVIN